MAPRHIPRETDMVVTPEQFNEIQTQRSVSNATRRAVSEGLESILFEAHQVLDHGFVRVVDYLGNDGSIVQAARVSYGAGTKKARGDEGLIRYLMRHRHTTPFEMCELKLHVKLPLFVARQWIRHRTANVNEYSARYSVLDREFYIPEPEHLSAQSSANAQGRDRRLPEDEAARAIATLTADSETAYEHYIAMMSEDGQAGLARELARMNLPANIYTQWYWKMDLHNLLRFIALRADAHAQYEIRAYAGVIGGIVRRWVPMAWKAFTDYEIGGARLSAAQLVCLRRMLAGDAPTAEDCGVSPREWREFNDILQGA